MQANVLSRKLAALKIKRSEKQPSSVRGYYTFSAGFYVERYEDGTGELIIGWRNSRGKSDEDTLPMWSQATNMPILIDTVRGLGFEVLSIGNARAVIKLVR